MTEQSQAEEKEPRHRGRPRLNAAHVEAAKRRIVGVARELFWNEGYQAVSMRGLAKAAGCTPATLYAYFENKAAILQHIWMDFFDALFDSLDIIAATTSDPARRLHTLAVHYIDYWLAHPDRYRMVFMTEGVSQTDVGQFLDTRRIARRYGVFFQAVADGIPDTADQAAEVKRRTDALICVLNGIVHNRITISAYDWTAPEDLLGLLLPGVLGPHGAGPPPR